MKPLHAILASLALAAAAPAQPFDLARAIAQAKPGDTIRVPAGTHAGNLTIDKALTLEGQPGATIDARGSGDGIVITAPGVTVRGLAIRATGDSIEKENAAIAVLAGQATIENNTIDDALFGIYLKNAPGCALRSNTIRGKDLPIARRGDGIRLWWASDTSIENNTVTDGRDAVFYYSQRLTIRGNTILRSRYGLHFMYSDDDTVEGNTLRDNSVGAFLMYSRRLTVRANTFEHNHGPSGYGLGLKDIDGVEARDNVFTRNRVALYIDNSPSRIDLRHEFARNTFAGNDIAVAFLPAVTRNDFHDNAFVDNLQQVAVWGGGAFRGNDFSPGGRGNYWSDYAGFDADHDGVGDLPYKSESLFENLMDRQPALRLFLYSPAQQAIEMAARAFPIVKPEPRFADAAPLLAPPAVPALAAPAPQCGMGLLSAGLLGLSLIVIGGAAVQPRRRSVRANFARAQLRGAA